MLELVFHALNPTVALVFIVTFFLAVYVINTPKMLNMPPGPFPFPVVGNLPELAKGKGDNVHEFQDMVKKYGKILSLKLGAVYFVVISDYETFIEAFLKKGDIFINRPRNTIHYFKDVDDKVGAGILFNDGPIWKQLRRTSISSLRDFGLGKQSLEERVHEEIGFFLDVIDKYDGQAFETKPWLTMATSNIISTVVLGSRFDYDDSEFQELMRVLNTTLHTNPLLNLDNFFPFLKHLPYYKKSLLDFGRAMHGVTDYVKKLTAERQESYDPEHMRDFVDLFIKSRREEKEYGFLDETNMRRAIVDLFLTGSDTTSNALSWFFLFMAKYPDVQARCQQEIDQVVGRGRRVTSADRDKLPYTEATILEVLRIRPIAPLGIFHSSAQDTELAGYQIPKDTLVSADIWTINHDPVTFPDPEQFKPEHFLDGQGKIVNRERMISFSAGPRVCLGENLARLELLCFVGTILQTYDLKPEPGKQVDLTPNHLLQLINFPQKVSFLRRD